MEIFEDILEHLLAEDNSSAKQGGLHAFRNRVYGVENIHGHLIAQGTTLLELRERFRQAVRYELPLRGWQP